MAMTAKQFCSRKYHLKNAYDADENAAGARDEGNTPEMVPQRILKASWSVVIDNYAALRSTSLGGHTNMVTGKEKAHG